MSAYGLLNVDGCIWIGRGREWVAWGVGGVGGGRGRELERDPDKRRGRGEGG